MNNEPILGNPENIRYRFEREHFLGYPKEMPDFQAWFQASVTSGKLDVTSVNDLGYVVKERQVPREALYNHPEFYVDIRRMARNSLMCEAGERGMTVLTEPRYWAWQARGQYSAWAINLSIGAITRAWRTA